MSKPNPIVSAFQGVERLAMQGALPRAVGAFVNAGQVYAPLIPFADAVRFMAGLHRGNATFVAGMQSLDRSSTVRETIAAASPVEQKDIVRALSRPSPVTLNMSEASRTFLSGVFTVGAGEWPMTVLHTILDSVIRAGGLGALALWMEARLLAVPPEETGHALDKLQELQQGFRWPLTDDEAQRLLVRGAKGNGWPRIEEDARHIQYHPTTFCFAELAAQHLVQKAIFPLSERRLATLSLTDFLLDRATRIDVEGGATGDEHPLGCCLPLAAMVGDVSVGRMPLGVYYYGSHIHVVDLASRIVIEMRDALDKLSLSGESQWQIARYLPAAPTPLPLRALFTALIGNAVLMQRMAPDEAMQLERAALRICPTDAMYRRLAAQMLAQGPAALWQAVDYLAAAEALHPKNPLTPFVCAAWMMLSGNTEKGRTLYARTRRLAEEQVAGIATMPYFQYAPFLDPHAAATILEDIEARLRSI